MSESQINLPSGAPAGDFTLPSGVAAAPAALPSRRHLAFLLQKVFSFPSMLAGLLVAAVFSTVRDFHVDPDLWWHIKVGDAILRTHHWPTVDPYSFTVLGQPWLAYEWLGEVLIAWASRIGGLRGLDFLLLLLGGSIVLSLYAFAALRSGNSKAAFIVCAILLPLTTVSFSLRPQMLGYLFLIWTLTALENFRQGSARSIWLLPFFMLLWVNTHGSWIIGLGTIFVYWMSGLFAFTKGDLDVIPWSPAQRRDISLSFLACLIVLPVTPYGTRLALSPFEFAFSLPLNVHYIQEWQSMPFGTVGGKLFLLVLLAMIFLQVVFRFRWRLEELLLFLGGTMMACVHVRFLLLFVPFIAPLLALIVASWIGRYDSRKDKFALNAILLAGIAASLIYYFPSRPSLEKSVSEQFPVKAVAYLQNHPAPEPMFDSYGYGGYLVYSRGPQHKVFIDGRADVYERGGVLADYQHIAQLAPGALDVLRGYGIQSCLLGRDEPLATVLSSSPAWKRIYFDDLSSLFVRTMPDNSQNSR